MIRLIAADMDGTLLDPNSTLTERTVAAARSAMEAGALFTLSSGRMPEAMIHFAERMQLNAPMILFNGALIYVGIHALVAVLSYLVLVGDIKRIELKPVVGRSS